MGLPSSWQIIWIHTSNQSAFGPQEASFRRTSARNCSVQPLSCYTESLGYATARKRATLISCCRRFFWIMTNPKTHLKLFKQLIWAAQWDHASNQSCANPIMIVALFVISCVVELSHMKMHLGNVASRLMTPQSCNPRWSFPTDVKSTLSERESTW